MMKCLGDAFQWRGEFQIFTSGNYIKIHVSVFKLLKYLKLALQMDLRSLFVRRTMLDCYVNCKVKVAH